MRHLDTNIVIAYLNGNHNIADKFKRYLPDVAISTIVLGELMYGAKASQRRTKNLERLQELMKIVDIVSFDEACAETYSDIRLSLRKKGRPTGEVDVIIAAIAIANDAVLVTDNTKHFTHIDKLRLENWLRNSK